MEGQHAAIWYANYFDEETGEEVKVGWQVGVITMVNVEPTTNFEDPTGPPNVSWYYDDPDFKVYDHRFTYSNYGTYWTLVPGGRKYSSEEARLVIKYKGFPPEKFSKAPNYVAPQALKQKAGKKRESQEEKVPPSNRWRTSPIVATRGKGWRTV